MLTDSGYRNQWTRIIRRDGRPVKPAPARIPDVNLYSAARREQRDQGDFFIQQTFGELLEQLPGDVNGQVIAVPDISAWKKHGNVALEAVGGVAALSTKNSESGVLVPFTAESPALYSLNVQYRSPVPVAIEIWNVDEQLRKITDITLYNDGLPPSPETWNDFKTTVFIPGLRGNRCALFISVAPSEQGKTGDAAEVRQKSRSRVCGLDASPLEANLITGWKWGRPAKKQFLFLRMTKFRTPFEAIDWRARSISQTVWALREETRKRSFTRT